MSHDKLYKNLERYNIYPKVRNTNLEDEYIREKYHLSRFQTNILLNRLKKVDEPYVENLIYNKYPLDQEILKLKDVDVAAKLIKKHIDNKSHIVIVTDYDSDGINSAVTLYRSFREVLKYKRINYILNKRRNGNGFNKTLVKQILALHKINKIDLIVSADHGSVDNESFKILRENGIELVITDHHTIPDDNYPTEANVFVNNQRKDSDYFRDISGCAVAFLVMFQTYKEIFGKYDVSKFYHIIPYVGISTITDVMSMDRPINRWFVQVGINEINSYRNFAWAAIKKTLGIPNKLMYKNIGFILGPLINSANRTDHEDVAFKMLIQNDFKEAMKYATELKKLNLHRKATQKVVLKEVKKELANYPHDDSFVCKINSDLAINGIIAANIGELIGLPTVCFMGNDDSAYLTGSCRAVLNAVNIVEVFKSIDNEQDGILLKYGGHKGAAGCSIDKTKLEDFKTLFNKHVKLQLGDIIPDRKIYVDGWLDGHKISPGIARAIDQMGPYGKDWDEPKYVSLLAIDGILVMGSVCRITFKTKDGHYIKAMYFFKDPYLKPDNIREVLPRGENVYVVHKMEISTFNNVNTLSLSIETILKANL